ncbi:MAG: transporter substrate-binding domain-containing protein [Gemmatimonadetes bacterium]|nr:transporter substrate-binding domain-containing protein [Gemmatimonadota bacterium]
MMRRIAILTAALVAPSITAACDGREGPRAARSAPIERDWAHIEQRDTLVLLATYNSTSYFLYRGQPMGLEYETVQAFAKDNGLELRTVLVRNRDEMFERLRAGEGDVLAGRVVPVRDERERIAFTAPLYRSAAAIVQQAAPLAQAGLPSGVDSILRARQPVRVRAKEIATIDQLQGERVHVAQGTAPQARLIELNDQLTGDVHVVAVEAPVADEALIRRVARGEIALTATHEDLARLTSARFENISVQPTVGDSFPVVLAVRENSPQLLERLNAWIGENEQKIGELYQKYFVDRRGYRERIESEYLTSETGRLSPFDALLRQAAAQLGWDWRLLASQAYQESRFDPRAQSWAGAQGLLQLMPATARENGVRDPFDPQQNVAGSIRFTRYLQEYWADKIPDPEQRLRFVLASYNTGVGHVEDARRLTAKNGGRDTVWSDVAYWLLQKSRRPVYTDPVVRYGFSRGLEPVTYVSAVMDRFAHYREFVRPGADPAGAAPEG